MRNDTTPSTRCHRRVALKFGILSVGLGLVGIGVLQTATGASAAPTSMDKFMGRWVGEGRLVKASGQAESYRCVVTYRRSKSGAGITQKMRCKNADDKVEAATELKISGGTVSGSWEEMRHNLGGAVSGKMTDSGFNLHLAGRFFAANMAVNVNNCAHVMKLVPTKMAKFKHLTAKLAKRCPRRPAAAVVTARKPATRHAAAPSAKSTPGSAAQTVAAEKRTPSRASPAAIVHAQPNTRANAALAAPVASIGVAAVPMRPALPVRKPAAPAIATPVRQLASTNPVRVRVQTIAVIPSRDAAQAQGATAVPPALRGAPARIDIEPIIPPKPVRIFKHQRAAGGALNQGQNSFDRISLGGWFIPTDAMYAGKPHRNARFVTR